MKKTDEPTGATGPGAPQADLGYPPRSAAPNGPRRGGQAAGTPGSGKRIRPGEPLQAESQASSGPTRR